MKNLSVYAVLWCLSLQGWSASLDFYIGKGLAVDPAIPTPSAVLGQEVGEWHIRHDQLVQYMSAVADASDRVLLEDIGRTHENRRLIQLIITSPANHQRLETIRSQHVKAVFDGDRSVAAKDRPIVVNMGYSVHGNESSAANAAVVMAYYLAAAREIADQLDNIVIILDPCLNPDGLSRFAQWANMHKGKQLVADSNHREHREGWPSGRTNHYWYDLNRDWLLLQHPESRARVTRLHQWRPTILTDHHEMGTNSTFFFQPGIPSRQNPLTPQENFDLTSLIATYHAAALDAQGELYYTQQSFDDFYYGKGSTYPDVQGSIGILFEQASSRGHVQENSYRRLTFPDTIKNQYTTSLSTMKAALENREKLLTYQQDFFPKAMDRAKRDKVKAYAFGSGNDPARARELAELLTRHQIKVHRLAKSVDHDGVTIQEGYVVPVEQQQYLLIKSLFQPMTSFPDNTFYDVSTWHMPSAYWTELASLDGKAFDNQMLGEALADPPFPTRSFQATDGAYAYLLDWRGYYAPRAAYRLLTAGVKVRFATRPFASDTDQGMQRFPTGTLMIPMGVQTIDDDELHELLDRAAREDAIAVYAAKTGLTPEGIDLGSGSMNELELPKILLLGGSGTSTYEVGELWHLLDVRLQIQVTVSELDRFGNIDLDDYTHLVMVNGFYDFSNDRIDEIKDWIREGGVLIGTKNAMRWAQQNKLVKLEMVTDEKKNGEEKEKEPKFLPYGEAGRLNAYNLISGAIFAGEIDLTHPLAYGVEQGEVALFRNSTNFFKPSDNPFNTVVRYSDEPLISGYVSAANLEKLKGSAAVIAQGMGRGAVILMADNPNFRGFWYGQNRLFYNGLFFGSAINPVRDPR